MQWNPPSLEEVSSEKIDEVFKPFSAELELQISSDESSRFDRILCKYLTALQKKKQKTKK